MQHAQILMENSERSGNLGPLGTAGLIGSSPHITIFGITFTPYETCIRKYVHVSGLARVHVLALQTLQRGSNYGFSVKEVIQTARSVIGRARRLGDRIADATKAKIAPQFTELTCLA
jgi:UDP-glucose 4-epimerase